MTPQLPADDLTGKIFSHLKIIGRVGPNRKTWICQCVCGKTLNIYESKIITNHKQSCGCMTGPTVSKFFTKHGRNPRYLYRTWLAMNQRCFNKDNPAYDYYGGRGITVCEEWRGNFERFRDDIGERPDVNYTVDRIDNNKGYSKDNCRWSTKKEQSNNTRKVIKVTVHGEIRNLREWCEFLGITISSLIYRRKKYQISNEETIRYYLKRKLKFQASSHNQELQIDLKHHKKKSLA